MGEKLNVNGVRESLGRVIRGKDDAIELLLIGVLSGGHILLEDVPGVGKTTLGKALARCFDADFARVQFTPDLLPSDITGTEVYYQVEGQSEFRFEPGPIFANIVLADEINRAPAKVQAALLEAMEERQVTVAGTTHTMPPLFMVMATQNPVEQEGTYPLPEAQLDRFLMHVNIEYATVEDEADREVRAATSGLNEVLRSVARLAHHDHLVMIFSDFAGIDETTHRRLSGLAAHNDLVLMLVFDPSAEGLAGDQRLVIGDSRMQAEVNLGAPGTREALTTFSRARLDRIRQWQNEINLSVLSLSAGEETLPQIRQQMGRLAPRRRIR